MPDANNLPAAHLEANVERFRGYADRYDRFRPQPPPALLDLLPRLAGIDIPQLVVDLGCGTGLSTRFWSGSARQVIGIEPSDDMRRQAEVRLAGEDATTVRYQPGFGHATGLPDACADIVTCSQSLHWMEPEPTLAEVARLLRPGGVFAAYDTDWPPAFHPEAEAAYSAFVRHAGELGNARGLYPGVHLWSKDEHLARIRASGRFRHSREVLLHHVESGGAERLFGLALTQGTITTLLKAGISEAELGVDAFRAAVSDLLGERIFPWYWSYRVRIGVR